MQDPIPHPLPLDVLEAMAAVDIRLASANLPGFDYETAKAFMKGFRVAAASLGLPESQYPAFALTVAEHSQDVYYGLVAAVITHKESNDSKINTH